MKRKILSFALALAAVLSLAVPAAAAGPVIPTGYSLIQLSSAPAGVFAPYGTSALVLEDGTKMSAVQGAMTVTRCAAETADDFYDIFYGYNEEPDCTEETAPAGQSIAVQGKAFYDVTVTAGERSENIRIMTRSMLDFLAAQPYGDAELVTWDIPAGAVLLEGYKHILTTAQRTGYAKIRLDYPAYYAWIFGDDFESDAQVVYSDVYPVFPANTVIAAPEGYVFGYGLTDFFGMGDGGMIRTRFDCAQAMDDGAYSLYTEAGGGRYMGESISFIMDSYGNSQFAALIRVDESELSSRKQLASSWAMAQVEQAIDAGLMTFGSGANLQNNAKRCEFASLMVNLYEKVTGKTAPVPEDNPFVDGYDTDMLKAYGLGLIKGTSDTTLSPYDSLTREQAAAIIVRLSNLLNKPLAVRSPTFADNAAISDYAVDPVGQVQAAGIMKGKENNLFDPQGKFTREESILTMMRLYEIIK